MPTGQYERKPRKRKISPEELRELYEVQGLSPAEIGARLGVSDVCAMNWLKADGTALRSKKQSALMPRRCRAISEGLRSASHAPPIVDEEFLYVVEERAWGPNRDGHYVAWVGGKFVYLHRHLWTLKHGSCPPILDHINRDKRDNRLENLRPATVALNSLNCKRPKRSKKNEGLPTGVTKRGGRYEAKSTQAGKYIYLGTYATPEEASAAYQGYLAGRIAEESQLALKVI